jgi:hypothetical protein
VSTAPTEERAPLAWGAQKEAPAEASSPALAPAPAPAPAPVQPERVSTAPASPLNYERQDGGPHKWFYLDPQGNVQGPFCSEDMAAWFEEGFFDGTLKVQVCASFLCTDIAFFCVHCFVFTLRSATNPMQQCCSVILTCAALPRPPSLLLTSGSQAVPLSLPAPLSLPPPL